MLLVPQQQQQKQLSDKYKIIKRRAFTCTAASYTKFTLQQPLIHFLLSQLPHKEESFFMRPHHFLVVKKII